MLLIFNDSTEERTIKDIFRFIWSYKILNAIIVVPFDNTIRIIGFNPYFDNYYQDLNSKNVFYNKLSNINGYTINVLMTRDEDITKLTVLQEGNVTKYGGKDGNLIMSLIEHGNATYNVTNLSKILGDNNPWRPINRGSMEEMKIPIIKQYDVDIILDSQELIVNNATEYMYPHARDDIVFLVPKAKLRSQYSQLSKIFREGFAVILLFFIIICPIVWFIFKFIHSKISKERLDYIKTLIKITLNNLRIVLGSSIHKIPKVFIENIFVIFLFFCNLIINSYFQSILASILTVSTHEPQINTIRDLANSDCRPLGVPGVINETAEVLKVIGQENLIPKLELLPPSKYYTHYKAFPSNLCALSNYDRMTMAVTIRPVLHVISESIVPTYMSFHVVQGSPYYDLLDGHILRILESGLYDMWKRTTFYHYVLMFGINDEGMEKGGYKDLTIHQFRSIFCLFGIGLGISFIVFLCELYCGYYNKRQ